MTSVRPESVKHRFAVDVARDRDELVQRLERMTILRPSGNVEPIAPFGFAYRREPDVFAAVAIGASLGTGILLSEFTFFNERYVSWVGRGLAIAAFVAAALLAIRFVRSSFTRWVVVADGADLVLRSTLGSFSSGEARYHADDVVSVQVRDGDDEPRRIVLGGPRHEVVAEVFRFRTLDPDSLAPYLAELVALVAQYASTPVRSRDDASVVPPSGT